MNMYSKMSHAARMMAVASGPGLCSVCGRHLYPDSPMTVCPSCDEWADDIKRPWLELADRLGVDPLAKSEWCASELVYRIDNISREITDSLYRD